MTSQFDTTLDYDYIFTAPDGEEMRFIAATSSENPYQRVLSQVLREQVDSNAEPGNASLAGWWIRTQLDWSAGAGTRVQEPVPDDETPRLRQYWQSSNLDTMTVPGEITMLPAYADKDTIVASGAKLGEQNVITSDVNATYIGVTNGFNFIAVVPLIGEHPGYKVGTEGNNITGLCVAGETLVAFSTQGIFTAPAFSPTDDYKPVVMTQRYTNSSGKPIIGTYIKQRVLAAEGPNLYELTDLAQLSGGEEGVEWEVMEIADLTPWYTNPDSTYEYTGVTETPRSILVAGYGTTSSEIFAITLESDGQLPTTEVPVSITMLPPNEFITDVRTYLGAYVAIGTTRGIRVGVLDADGFVTYGPLLDAPKAQTRFSFYDRFVIYGGKQDGVPHVIRVDLSEIDNTGRAAWSTLYDVTNTSYWTEGSEFFGLAVQSDENIAVFTVTPTGFIAYNRPAVGNKPDPGWIEMPLVRFGTLEKKNFLSLTVTKISSHGDVRVLLSTDEGSFVELGTVADGVTTQTLPIDADPAVEARVRLEFTATGSDPVGVHSIQLRSLVAPENRSELVNISMMNFDFERDGHGVTVGYEYRAWDRYRVFRDLVRDGETITVSEPHNPDVFRAVVQDLSFTQTAAPSLASGFGGVLKVLLRTVE